MEWSFGREPYCTGGEPSELGVDSRETTVAAAGVGDPTGEGERYIRLRGGSVVEDDEGDAIGSSWDAVDSSGREGSAGEWVRYTRCSGGNLYWTSPEVSKGYNDEEECDDDEEGNGDTDADVNLAGGPRCTGFENLGSTGSGRPLTAVLRGTIVRMDLVIKSAGES